MREKVISDHSLFASYEGQQGAANGQDSWAFFRDAQGFGRLHAGSHAGFTNSRPPPPWTCVALRNLDLLIKTEFEHRLSALLLRTLAMGRRQQSESIEVVLDIK